MMFRVNHGVTALPFRKTSAFSAPSARNKKTAIRTSTTVFVTSRYSDQTILVVLSTRIVVLSTKMGCFQHLWRCPRHERR